MNNDTLLILMLSMYCLLPLQKLSMSCTYQEIGAMVDPKVQPETPTRPRPKHLAHGRTYTNLAIGRNLTFHQIITQEQDNGAYLLR